jgi:hypothetical protein
MFRPVRVTISSKKCCPPGGRPIFSAAKRRHLRALRYSVDPFGETACATRNNWRFDAVGSPFEKKERLNDPSIPAGLTGARRHSGGACSANSLTYLI